MTIMITVLLLHLGVLHGPHKVHHELFCNPVDTIRVFALHFLIPFGIFLFQVHQAHGGHFRYWVVHFELLQGKKLVVLGLVGFGIAPWSLPFLLPLQPKGNWNKSFCVGWFEVGHHCFKSLG